MKEVALEISAAGRGIGANFNGESTCVLSSASPILLRSVGLGERKQNDGRNATVLSWMQHHADLEGRVLSRRFFLGVPAFAGVVI